MKNKIISIVGSVVFSLAMLCGLWFSIQTMSAALLRARADKLHLTHDLPGAEKIYLLAEKIDPQDYWAPLGLGQIYSNYRYNKLEPEAKREWALKEQAAFARAYRNNVKKEEIVYGLGRAELACGNRTAGLKYLRQAADYKRFNDYYWIHLGFELRKAGLYEEALERFLYAQKLNRSSKTVKRNIQWLREIVEREK